MVSAMLPPGTRSPDCQSLVIKGALQLQVQQFRLLCSLFSSSESQNLGVERTKFLPIPKAMLNILKYIWKYLLPQPSLYRDQYLIQKCCVLTSQRHVTTWRCSLSSHQTCVLTDCISLSLTCLTKMIIVNNNNYLHPLSTYYIPVTMLSDLY
jgi:hypothetical protein